MDEISKFFKGLYYQFLLRDVVAKVIPGLLPLIILSSMGGGISDNLFGFSLGTGSAWVNAIVLFGLGLMLGILLQYIGNRTYVFGARNVDWGPKTITIVGRSIKLPHIKFSMPALDWTPIIIDVWGSAEESMKKELDFRHYANQSENRDHVLDKRARLVAFKEMAGTYAAAISLAFVFRLIYWIIALLDDLKSFDWVDLRDLAIFWVIVMVLCRLNRTLAKQQYIWEKIIIAAKGKLPATSAAVAAKKTKA
jgi:hypothetical protein